MSTPEIENHTQAGPSAQRAPHPGAAGDGRIALLIALLLACVYLLTISGRQHYGDELKYIVVAHNWMIYGLPAEEITLVSDGTSPPRLVPTWSILPPGQSLLLMPFEALQVALNGGLPHLVPWLPRMATLLPLIECAAAGGLLFLLVRATGQLAPALRLSRRTAALLALAAGIATQLWAYSSACFSDTSVMVLLLASVTAAVRFRLSGRPAAAVAALGLPALAFLCRPNCVLVAPVFGLYVGWAALHGSHAPAGFSGRRALAVLLPAALIWLAAVGLSLWFNQLRYGSPFQSGYHTDHRTTTLGFSTPLLVGLYGHLLSTGRSVFLFSPLCLLALFGARRFWRRAPAEALLAGGILVPLLLLFSKWWAWSGGWEWGTRFLMVAVPLLAWISMPAWRWMDRRPSWPGYRLRAALLGLLLGAGIFVQTMGWLIPPVSYFQILGSGSVAVFPSPIYKAGSWELRDDMVMAHFVPEFSPVAAHMWLAWATWNRHLPDDVLAARAPWSSLNRAWAPRVVKPYLGYDPWLIRLVQVGGGARWAGLGVGMLLACTAALTAFRLRRTIGRTGEQERAAAATSFRES